MNEVFKNYHHEGIFDYIKKEYSSKIKETLLEYEDYFDGMENSSEVLIRNTYLEIFNEILTDILDELHDLGTDAFINWQVELKLFFLLLIDLNNITPSKEMFKDFMDNPEVFTREMKLSQIIAA